MTRNLLTALLIAGLPVTVKAEPTVYYCVMKTFVRLTTEGEVERLTPERFSMKVEGKTVSFGGDGYMKSHKGELTHTFNPKLGAFLSTDNNLSLFANILTVTNNRIGLVDSFIARCDNF